MNTTRTIRTNTERGAFAVLAGILMFLLIAVAGLAVDLGSFYSQSSNLQSASDAAALAGATEQSRSGDLLAVQAEVDRVLRANGVSTSDPTIVTTVAISPSGEVTVELRDTDVDLYFSNVVMDDFEIARTSTAFLDACGASCTQDVEIPRPFDAIQTPGSGDGWMPVMVGDRIYAINHHIIGGAIMCVDRTTQVACPGYPMSQGSIAGAADLFTGNRPDAAVYSDRFYYNSNTDTHFGLACWDTSNDSACPFINLLAATPGPTQTTYARGGGTIMVNDRIFVFDDNHGVHCFNPASVSMCPGYPKVLPFAAAGFAYNEGDNSGLMRSSIEHAGRIYHTHPQNWDTGEDAVVCWDTNTNLACAGFGTNGYVTAPHANPWSSGRLFFRLDTSGNHIGFCRQRQPSAVGPGGVFTHDCWDLSGTPTGTVPGLDAAVSDVTWDSALGDPLLVNVRTYFTDGWTGSRVDCWDWSTQSSCGFLVGNVNGAPTEDYGLVAEGNCIFALGHNSIFWTFDYDMNVGCFGGSAEIVIYPCICADGTAHWGQVEVSGDLRSVAGPFTVFNVEVQAPDGTTVLDVDLMDTDGQVDLDAIPTTYTYLTIIFTIEAKPGPDPWATGQIPRIQVGWRDQPYLTN